MPRLSTAASCASLGSGGRLQKLTGSVAVVTGATSGIGNAIARALASAGSRVACIGRDPNRLQQTLHALESQTPGAKAFQIDLTAEGCIDSLAAGLKADFGRVDILVHSSGIMQQGSVEEAPAADFDAQYAANLRAPYVLTQTLLPLLKSSRGQIVFINSSLGLLNRRAGVSQYAALEHGLKALADGLREEVNGHGIRVLSVYVGRTATPRQEALHRMENNPYRPELLLQPEDVAAVVIHALALPSTAEITDINIRPMLKTISYEPGKMAPKSLAGSVQA